jgi:signal transduction histidine kinase
MMNSIQWEGRWPRWRQVSILVKVGTTFIALALTFAIFLLTTSNLTKQLIGTSKAIEQAGTERMRIYKLASLMQQLTPSSKNERELIRNEIVQFERVVEGLRVGTPRHGSVAALSPMLSVQLQALQDRWVMELRPTLELALEGGEPASAVKEYLVKLDDFVAGWDLFVQSMEQQSAGRLQSLYRWQNWFLVLFFGLMGAALIFFDRVVREPLKQLTAGADRLAAGELHTEIRIRSDDELGQLARTFKRMAETIEQKIGELNALHATGQEIGLLGSGGLDDVLRRIADRAAESLHADIAVVLVRHPTMECWLMETASGTAFDRLRKEILLFEETPFSNQAYETKRPVVVADLAAHKDKPIRFRDEFGAQSYMAVPLLGPHECPGVLVLLSIAHQRTFSVWDVQMAQQFASYAAVTMENARFFDAVESESQDLREQLREVERKVAELTHEVKAPAGRVAEFASWIERDYGTQLGAKGQQYIAWIKNEGKDLAALAERTLYLARINQQPSPLERVDLDSVVREVLVLLGKECLAGNVQITIAPNLPYLACRRIHVKQVFENLIGNAIKYMGDQPHPQVEIGTVEGLQGMLVFVRDNGIGIEPSMKERIFLPFVRLGTGNVAGSGIGLSIVRTVVEQYEGSVSVDSIPGVGSTFFVQLPVILRKPSNPPAPVQPVVTQLETGPDRNRPRALVGKEESSI